MAPFQQLQEFSDKATETLEVRQCYIRVLFRYDVRWSCVISFLRLIFR